MLTRKGAIFGLVLIFPAGLAMGGEAIPNWSAPATWSPHSASRGVSTMSDVTNPLPFIGVSPCRLVDTRGTPGVPITGGTFGANEARTWTFTGLCGLPLSAAAVSLNITVTNTGANPFGFVKVWPAGGTEPNVSTLNWSAGGVTESNAAIVPLGTGVAAGKINLRSGNAGSDVLVDVNGYYSETTTTNRLPSTEFLAIYGAFAGGGVVVGENNNAQSFSSGVRGVYTGTGMGFGVNGVTTSTAVGSSGVLGNALDGQTSGVLGNNTSTNILAAGVTGATNQAPSNAGSFRNTGAGAVDTFLGTQVSAVNYGVYTTGRILGASLDIVAAPKNFASPHPLDAAKEIKYASVEAPTVDVYFRGTGTLLNGYARIEVPDHFRFTARQGTYMTTLTPVGRAISLSVDSEGPEGIVIRGSGNTRFHYVVYAERAEIEGYEPVQPNVNFTPEALEKGGMLRALPEPTRALLIRNGTLNPDGTYNQDTARAMGWSVPEAADKAAAAR